MLNFTRFMFNFTSSKVGEEQYVALVLLYCNNVNLSPPMSLQLSPVAVAAAAAATAAGLFKTDQIQVDGCVKIETWKFFQRMFITRCSPMETWRCL
jgi:hypothetical protein